MNIPLEDTLTWKSIKAVFNVQLSFIKFAPLYSSVFIAHPGPLSFQTILYLCPLTARLVDDVADGITSLSPVSTASPAFWTPLVADVIYGQLLKEQVPMIIHMSMNASTTAYCRILETPFDVYDHFSFQKLVLTKLMAKMEEDRHKRLEAEMNKDS